MFSVPFSCPRATSGTTITDSGATSVPSTQRTRGSRWALFARTGSQCSADQPVMPAPNGNGSSASTASASVPIANTGLSDRADDVCLVEGEAVVRHELVEGAGDPLEQLVEGLLGQHLVEHVRELHVRLDDTGVARAVRLRMTVLEPRCGGRGVWARIHEPLPRLIGLPSPPLEGCPRCTLAAVAGRIVVGVDGSEAAVAALRFAVEEAKLRDATLVIVFAWTFVPPAAVGEPGVIPDGRHHVDGRSRRRAHGGRPAARRGARCERRLVT